MLICVVYRIRGLSDSADLQRNNVTSFVKEKKTAWQRNNLLARETACLLKKKLFDRETVCLPEKHSACQRKIGLPEKQPSCQENTLLGRETVCLPTNSPAFHRQKIFARTTSCWPKQITCWPTKNVFSAKQPAGQEKIRLTFKIKALKALKLFAIE